MTGSGRLRHAPHDRQTDQMAELLIKRFDAPSAPFNPNLAADFELALSLNRDDHRAAVSREQQVVARHIRQHTGGYRRQESEGDLEAVGQKTPNRTAAVV
jgi:hypothetical protein